MKFEEAIECYNAAIQIQPSDDSYYYNKGISLHELKRYKEAIECYDKAIEIQPNDHSCYYYKGTLRSFNKGKSLKELKRYKDALSEFQKAIDIKPSHIYITSYALILEEQNQKVAAYLKFQEVLHENPNYQIAINGVNRLK